MSRQSFEGEIRDNVYRLKLAVLKERIQKDQNNLNNDEDYGSRAMEVPPWIESKKYDQDLEIKYINMELNAAKEKQEKLKNKLKAQKLQNQVALSIPKNTPSPEKNVPDRFSQYIEMLMIQQAQNQTMLTNQLLLKEQKQKKSKPNPYLFPPSFPPSYPPMYSYPYPPFQPYEPAKYKQPSPVVIQETQIKPPNRISKPKDLHLQYPGNDAQQTLRRLGLAALFCVILESDYDQNSVSLSDKFLFELKIKEIIISIQKYYLKSNGPIFTLLQSVISNSATNFRSVLTKGANDTDVESIKQEINAVLEDLVAGISQIMPFSGVLGCESRSLLSELLQTNQRFPDKYFLERELDLIEVDSLNIGRNIGTLESKAILIGIFYVRALVTTIMLKPIEYGLTTYLSTTGKDNLRILSSLLIRVYRMVLGDLIEQKYPTPVPENPKTPSNKSTPLKTTNDNPKSPSKTDPNNDPKTANKNQDASNTNPKTANKNQDASNTNPKTANNNNPKSPTNNNQNPPNSKPNSSNSNAKTPEKRASTADKNEEPEKIFITGPFGEFNDALLTDDELEPLINSTANSTKLCKTTIFNWANTYVMKLRPV